MKIIEGRVHRTANRSAQAPNVAGPQRRQGKPARRSLAPLWTRSQISTMNLYFRLLYFALKAILNFRPSVDPFSSTLTMRVLPNDLDLSGHMNNGRFLTVCDLNRFDVFLKSGLARLMLEEKWTPVIVGHTMEYKKSLRLLERFTASMSISSWDDRFFYAKHTFMRNGSVAAIGRSVAALRSSKGIVSPAHCVRILNARRLGLPPITSCPEHLEEGDKETAETTS